MKKSTAAIIAVLLACLTYVVVVALTDRILRHTSIPAGKERRAALALRDNVTPFQKWGSEHFTWPYLEGYYDAAWYFTQSDSDNRKQAFLYGLDAALKRYKEVDLYLLAHDNHFVSWVGELPPERRGRIRLVYNTGCRDLQQGPLWLSLGAKAYVGHPGVSASPVFYFYFLRRWSRGATLGDAIDESNGLMRATLARAQVFSFGTLDAARTSQESEAFCYGEKNCGSREPQSEKKGRGYLAIPVVALLFQLVPPSLLWAVSIAAYAEPRRLSESWEWPVSLLVLALSAGVSLFLGTMGVYGLLVRARPTIAVWLILICCIPALLGGAIYLHGLLVFLAWV